MDETLMTDDEIDEFIYPKGKWPQKRDMTGVSVSGFVVISHHKHTTKSKQAHWLLRCKTCGFEKVLRGEQIRNKCVGECKTCNPKVPKVKPVAVRRKSKMTLLLEKVQELESRLDSMQSN